MFYESYTPKRKHGCLGRMLKWIFSAAVLWIVAVLAVTAFTNLTINGGGEDLAVNGDLPKGWTNILLLGGDSGSAEAGRTDTILVASIGSSGQLKLTSLMRDTMLDMGEYGAHKLNAAYKLGGAPLVMRTVNQAFALNITKYALVDFESFPRLIDAVGGVVLDVSEAERKQLNKNMRSSRRAVGISTADIQYLQKAGEGIRLTGEQALGYARIRSIDSDYQRAARQRNVLEALLKAARGTKNPLTLLSLGTAALQSVSTNINAAQMASLGLRVLLNGAELRQYRIPAEDAYKSGTFDGVWMIKPNLEKNRELLKAFIYG